MSSRRLGLVVSLILAALCAGSAQAETLRLRADSWMPYNGDAADPLPGYAIEIARQVCAEHGITLDYQTMSWGDAIKAAGAGEIDAVVGANKQEITGLVVPKLCIGLPRVALIVGKDSSWRYQNVTSLQPVRLGVVADYKYWPAIDEYITKNGEPRVHAFSGDQPLVAALGSLTKGEVDVVVETSTVYSWTVKSAGYAPGSFRVVYLHEGDPVFFAFAPQGDAGKRYAQWFDETLTKLRQNGELAKLLARYGLTDWAE